MFDIVIPIWKMKTQYLRNCLHSIQAQTFTDWKVYIIDGSPTDWENYEEQQNFINEIIDSDERIEYHRHQNLKEPFVSEAMNQGTKLGSNPYVCYLGGDDFYYNHFLDETVNWIDEQKNKEEVGVYFCMVQQNVKTIIDMGEFEIGRVHTEIVNHYLIHPLLDKKFLPYFHYGTPIFMNGATFQRKAVEEVNGFDEKLVLCEDTDLVMKLLKKGYISVWLPFVGAYLRLHNEQTGRVSAESPFGIDEKKKELFDMCFKRFNKKHGKYYLMKKEYKQVKKLLKERYELDFPRNMTETIRAMNHTGYVDKAKKYVREKEMMFLLKNEEEKALFLKEDIIIS